MAIPRETSKEMIVIVENDSLDVVISPPVLDSVMVVGVPPAIDPRTLLFDKYDDTALRLKTAGGLIFNLNGVERSETIHAGQVIFGSGVPSPPTYPDDIKDRIFFSTDMLSIYYTDTNTPTPAGYQIIVNSSTQITGTTGQILFHTGTGSDFLSIYKWEE